MILQRLNLKKKNSHKLKSTNDILQKLKTYLNYNIFISNTPQHQRK